MDAEILFFMTAKDQSEFLTIAKQHCDWVSNSEDSNEMLLKVASCHLLFTPSKHTKNTLYVGKLEIRLSKLSNQVGLIEQEQAKKVFRYLRNWLKQHYWSRLAYLNQNKKGKLTPSRNHWLGPDAKLWKEEDEDKHVLKLSQTSWMVFELGY